MRTSIPSISKVVLLGLILFSTTTISAEEKPTQDISTDAVAEEHPLDVSTEAADEKKPLESLAWLKKEHAKAAFELAVLYESGGQGMEQDYDLARTYYEKAMAEGHSEAQLRMALLFGNESTSFSDLAKSRALLNEMAEAGNADAQFELSNALNNTRGTVKAQPGKAFDWLKRAAEEGHAKAQLMLGGHYLGGEYVGKNAEVALDWFRKAAKQGEAEAHFSLALVYDRGDDGVEKDSAKAVKWYESAVALGNVVAMQNLGVKYMLGEHVRADIDKALALITHAAESGLGISQLLLGRLYQSGYEGYIRTNLVQARKWYLRAAEQGNADAQYRLAQLLLDAGEERTDAIRWISKAADAGHKEAQSLKVGL